MDSEPVDLQSALDDCSAALQKAEQRAAQYAAEAQTASDETQQMLYAVGHDLRAALRAVLSYTQLLQRQVALDENARELTGFIVNGANEMNAFVENLLKYSRLGNPARRTAIGLDSVVQFALFNLQADLRESGAEVNFHDLPVLFIDESQFVQLFQELIGNAIKFRGAERPQIEITAQEHDDVYCFEVRDNSVGIGPQYHEAVFAPFKRLHGKDVPGVGLGLPACRKILRGHKGRIWVESNGRGGGSAFKFTVPIS